jgi:hypothetical protein
MTPAVSVCTFCRGILIKRCFHVQLILHATYQVSIQNFEKLSEKGIKTKIYIATLSPSVEIEIMGHTVVS